MRRSAVLFVACWLTGWAFSGAMHFGLAPAWLWAPTGIALAALLRWDVSYWPAISLGSAAATLSSGAPLWVAALIALGDTLAAVFGVWALRRGGLRVELDRRRDLWRFIALGMVLATLCSAANAVVWWTASGVIPRTDALEVLLDRWLAGAVGTLVVGVPLLTFSREGWRRATADRAWFATALLGVATIAGAALAWGIEPDTGAPLLRSPWLFLPHLLLCWLALRAGLFIASTTALVLTLAAVLTATQHMGPFVGAAGGGAIPLWATYVCSLMAAPLLATALVGELAASERRWRSAFDSAQIGVAEWNIGLGSIRLSTRWLALLGHAESFLNDRIQTFWSLLHPDDLTCAQLAFDVLRSGNAPDCRTECRMQCRDGRWRWFELHATVSERLAGGIPACILMTARDISAARAAREVEALSRSVFEHLREGVLITDAQHRVIEANPIFSEITGDLRADLIGAVPSLLQPQDAASDHDHQLAGMRQAMANEASWRGQLLHRRLDGEPRLLQVAASVVRSAAGGARHHVLTIADESQRRADADSPQRRAQVDELTRLPNRVRLAQLLQSAMQTSRRDGSLLTVCYLDLDHFKPVNDLHGHEAGDRLLIELTARMRRSLRSWAGGDDVVARIGGDEFVLLLRTATLEESRHAVERVLGQVSLPYAFGDGAAPVIITASIGATVFPLDGADAETLLRHADHAMYGAKQAGRNGYLFFDAEHDRRAEARFAALGRVQEALDANEFRLYFQPKVDMRTAQVLGVEALLRWTHPDQGVISPAQFLPLIENTGLSISVGNWVMQQGIEQLARWLRLGLDLTVSINVSARHLQEPLFAQHLAGLLSRHQPAVAHRLIIEVLETTALADVGYTGELMQQCRELGVRFALDDFGTGYSTFTYLKQLPIDMLKIDRSFVTHMLDDRQDLAIIDGVIALSHTFDCTVVAEGVESRAQARRLIEAGCHVGQGNGIAAAMPADAVPGWIRDYKGMSQALEDLAQA